MGHRRVVRAVRQPVSAPDPGDRLGLRSLAIPAPELLLSYFKAVNERTLRFITSLDEAGMDAHLEPDEPRQTIAGSLRHIIVHQNNHHGQIDYLRACRKKTGTCREAPGASCPRNLRPLI